MRTPCTGQSGGGGVFRSLMRFLFFFLLFVFSFSLIGKAFGRLVSFVLDFSCRLPPHQYDFQDGLLDFLPVFFETPRADF